QENIDVLLDEVTGISPKQRIVHLKPRDLANDFLILATGIRYNYFGHDEWRPFAPAEVFVIGDTAHVVASVRNLLGNISRTPMLMPGVAQPGLESLDDAHVIRNKISLPFDGPG